MPAIPLVEATAEDPFPAEHGSYVAYVDNDMVPRFAARIFLSFDGEWSYPLSDQRFRGRVHAWLGPLPALKMEGR